MILFHATCLLQEAATRASKQQPGSWWCNDGRHRAPEIRIAALRVLNAEKVRKVPVCVTIPYPSFVIITTIIL